MDSKSYILALCALAFSLSTNVTMAQQSQEQMAAYYYDNGQFEQAALLYETLYKTTDNNYYYQRLFSTYLRLEKYKEALTLVERREKAAPGDLCLMVDAGYVYQMQKQQKKAIKCYERALAAITANLAPVPGLAMAFVKAGNRDYAIKTYLRAREKTHNPYLYFNELVGVYQEMGDFEAMTNEYFSLLDNQPGLISSIQVSMQKALAEAPDERLAQGVRQALVERVRNHPENRNYLEMMIWFSLQQNDFLFALTQAKAIDCRYPDLNGEPVFRVARIAFDNDAYNEAIEAYRYLIQKGTQNPYYFESRVGELMVEFSQLNNNYSIESGRYVILKEKYESAIRELGVNDRTVRVIRNYANLLAYYGNDAQSAVNLLDDVLALPRLSSKERDEVKIELGDLLLFSGSIWDASLLYMQVEKANKDDVIGSMAKYKNARLSYYNHDFEWANSQLKVLRSSTSKLIANDAMELSLLISDNMEDDSTYGMLSLFADADLLLYRNMLDTAWGVFDNIAQQSLSHPLFDEILMRKAQIRMKQTRYVEADSILQRLVDFYPEEITSDDALMMMAELNEQYLGNLEKARQCYEKMLIDYPTSLYVDRARKRYNALKVR